MRPAVSKAGADKGFQKKTARKFGRKHKKHYFCIAFQEKATR